MRMDFVKFCGVLVFFSGLVLIWLGFKTLFPVVISSSDTIQSVEFSISIAWPSFLMCIFLLRYAQAMGRNFFYNT